MVISINSKKYTLCVCGYICVYIRSIYMLTQIAFVVEIWLYSFSQKADINGNKIIMTPNTVCFFSWVCRCLQHILVNSKAWHTVTFPLFWSTLYRSVVDKTCPVCRESLKSTDDTWVLSEVPDDDQVNEEIRRTLIGLAGDKAQSPM